MFEELVFGRYEILNFAPGGASAPQTPRVRGPPPPKNTTGIFGGAAAPQPGWSGRRESPQRAKLRFWCGQGLGTFAICSLAMSATSQQPPLRIVIPEFGLEFVF